MNIDELKAIALKGFDGNGFYLAKYKNQTYLAHIDGEIYVFSNDSISEKSTERKDGFMTKVNISDLDDFFFAKLSVTFQGNIYETGRVGKRLNQIELIARKGLELEDKKLGFEDDLNERVTHCLIYFGDIEGISISMQSVYDEYLLKNE